MNYLSKLLAALVALLAMTTIASRQTFLSLSAADRSFLFWLFVGAGLAASIAGGLMFRSIGRYQKMKWSKVEITPTGRLLTALPGNAFINQGRQLPFDAER